MASTDIGIDKPQRGRPKRAELLDINITRSCKALILRELLKFIILLETNCNKPGLTIYRIWFL